MKTTHQPISAVLVGVQLPEMKVEELEDSLRELSRLVHTLGYKVVGQMSQKRESQRAGNVLGEGKLVELAGWTGGTGKVASAVRHKKSKAAVKRETEATGEETPESEIEPEPETEKIKAQVIIFDCDLTPSQLRNVESATGASVLDRTGVIIEIFSRHARTKAAKLQVEIAKLNYVAPRLRETGGSEIQEGGGGKGSGEKSIELDKRRIRDRLKELRDELVTIGSEHDVRRARRHKENKVALVGYTNAGKSSLMRALTGSEVLIADKLFATLDTTVRPMHPETQPKILVSDTVGFIKKLPHDLVASFKSTLDEAADAALLLFVVDSSDASFRSQLEVTQKVLSEVGADDVPRLMVFNKRDLLSESDLEALKIEFPEGVFISTRAVEDIKNIRNRVLGHFEKDMVEEDLFIDYAVKGAIGEIRSRMRVLTESFNERGVVLRVKGTPQEIADLKRRVLP
ncbi:MAG: GTPase HflX [Pseudomonadota bacterium]|nr:GTPase HflX [Pseudomonadota bacterium]